MSNATIINPTKKFLPFNLRFRGKMCLLDPTNYDAIAVVELFSSFFLLCVLYSLSCQGFLALAILITVLLSQRYPGYQLANLVVNPSSVNRSCTGVQYNGTWVQPDSSFLFSMEHKEVNAEPFARLQESDEYLYGDHPNILHRAERNNGSFPTDLLQAPNKTAFGTGANTAQLAEIISTKFATGKKIHENDHRNQEDPFLLQLISTVLENIENVAFSTSDLYKCLAMSSSKFHRKVNEVTKMKPNQIIRCCRLLIAKSLLLTTELSITDITAETGFSDPAYFSRKFTQEFGECPTQYRKKHRTPTNGTPKS